MFYIKKYLFLGALFLMLAGCATNPVSGKREIRLFSDKDEVTLGTQTKQAIILQYGLVDDPQLQAYIEEMGKKLVSVSERKYLPYNFTILNTPMINAFAAPGGCIFVTKGILLALKNDGELATIIGHEIGHVSARHSMGALEKQYGYQIAFKITEVITKKDLSGLKSYANALAGLIILGYGRDNEYESDRCGLKYCMAAGYDARGMATFFERLKQLEGSPPSQLEILFRSHPPTEERIARANQYLASQNYVPPASSAGNETYQNRIKRLKEK